MSILKTRVTDTPPSGADGVTVLARPLTNTEVDENFLSIFDELTAATTAIGSAQSDITSLQSDVSSLNSSIGGKLSKASNLSDLANAATARSNLGLGTAATQDSSAFMQSANNLSDLASAATARSNLGLGTAATHAHSDYATAAQGATADSAYSALSAKYDKAGGPISGNVSVTGTVAAVSVYEGHNAPAFGSTTTLDISTGTSFNVTATGSGAAALTLSNVPAAGNNVTVTLILTNGGLRTWSYPAGTKWPGGTAPTLTASGTDILQFFTRDGGTTLYGFLAGKDVK